MVILSAETQVRTRRARSSRKIGILPLVLAANALTVACGGKQLSPPVRPGVFIGSSDLAKHTSDDVANDRLAIGNRFYVAEAIKTNAVAASFVSAIPPGGRDGDITSSSSVALRRLLELFEKATDATTERGLDYVPTAAEAAQGATADAPTEPILAALSEAYVDHVKWAERRLEQGLPPGYVIRNTLLPVTLDEAEIYLGSDKVALSYFSTNEQTFVFVVAKGKSKVVALGPTAKIADAATELRSRIMARDPEWKRSSDTLCRLVIDPLTPFVEGYDRVVLTGHRSINGIPWTSVCTDPDKFSRAKTIAELPSLTFLRYVNSSTITRTAPKLVTFGNPVYPISIPSLPNAEREAMIVAATIAGARSYLGAAATESALVGELESSSVVHLATHALALAGVNGIPPLIFLAADPEHDGILTTAEIAHLNMRGVELAVLSACQSGTTTGGSAVDSLSAAFLVAGTRTTVTSLWSVDDAATARLMTEFYARLWSSGPALAMRDAQRVVASQPGWEHPYYWASFQVSGGL